MRKFDLIDFLSNLVVDIILEVSHVHADDRDKRFLLFVMMKAIGYPRVVQFKIFFQFLVERTLVRSLSVDRGVEVLSMALMPLKVNLTLMRIRAESDYLRLKHFFVLRDINKSMGLN